MTLTLDTDHIRNSLILEGHGGKERLLEMAFKGGVQRVNHSLFDFCIDGIRVEVKRQQDVNWFDYGKYHNLSDADGKIIVVFFLHKNSRVRKVAGITLRSFIELCCSDARCIADGWTYDAMAEVHKLKLRHPSLQSKAKAQVDRLINAYPDRFTLYYET